MKPFCGFASASRVLAIAALFCLSGCSSDSGVSEDEVTVDLRQIARAYEVSMLPNGKPPRDLNQIQNVLKDLHIDGLVGNPDDVLMSSRDGQPYVIILGAPLGNDSSGEVLAYEKQGADGTRYVLTMSRDVRVLSNEEFAKARFTQGHKPAVP